MSTSQRIVLVILIVLGLFTPRGEACEHCRKLSVPDDGLPVGLLVPGGLTVPIGCVADRDTPPARILLVTPVEPNTSLWAELPQNDPKDWQRNLQALALRWKEMSAPDLGAARVLAHTSVTSVQVLSGFYFPSPRAESVEALRQATRNHPQNALDFKQLDLKPNDFSIPPPHVERLRTTIATWVAAVGAPNNHEPCWILDWSNAPPGIVLLPAELPENVRVIKAHGALTETAIRQLLRGFTEIQSGATWASAALVGPLRHSDQLPPSEKEALIHRFAPFIRAYPEQRPICVSEFLSLCGVQGNLDQKHPIKVPTGSKRFLKLRDDWKADYDSGAKQFPSVLYARLRPPSTAQTEQSPRWIYDDRWWLQYYVLFPKNFKGAPEFVQHFQDKDYQHEGDWLCIDLTLKPREDKSVAALRASDFDLVEAVIHNHGRQFFVRPDEGLAREGDQVAIWLERESNEPQPAAGGSGEYHKIGRTNGAKSGEFICFGDERDVVGEHRGKRVLAWDWYLDVDTGKSFTKTRKDEARYSPHVAANEALFLRNFDGQWGDTTVDDDEQPSDPPESPLFNPEMKDRAGWAEPGRWSVTSEELCNFMEALLGLGIAGAVALLAWLVVLAWPFSLLGLLALSLGLTFGFGDGDGGKAGDRVEGIKVVQDGEGQKTGWTVSYERPAAGEANHRGRFSVSHRDFQKGQPLVLLVPLVTNCADEIGTPDVFLGILTNETNSDCYGVAFRVAGSADPKLDTHRLELRRPHADKPAVLVDIEKNCFGGPVTEDCKWTYLQSVWGRPGAAPLQLCSSARLLRVFDALPHRDVQLDSAIPQAALDTCTHGEIDQGVAVLSGPDPAADALWYCGLASPGSLQVEPAPVPGLAAGRRVRLALTQGSKGKSRELAPPAGTLQLDVPTWETAVRHVTGGQDAVTAVATVNDPLQASEIQIQGEPAIVLRRASGVVILYKSAGGIRMHREDGALSAVTAEWLRERIRTER